MDYRLSKTCLENIADCIIDAFEVNQYPLNHQARNYVYETITKDPVYSHDFTCGFIILIVKTYLKDKINNSDKENNLALNVFSEFISIMNYRIHENKGENYAKDFSFNPIISSHFLFVESSEISKPGNNESSSTRRQDDWGELAFLDPATKFPYTKQ